MNTALASRPAKRALPDFDKVLDALGAWVLAIVWISPLLFATWAALQPSGTALGLDFSNPLTFENFTRKLYLPTLHLFCVQKSCFR